jgi:polyisoprenoid-binding protein YceI
MKSFNRILLASAALIFTSADMSAKNTYTLSKGYVVTINGTSNLHDWTETVGTVTGDGTVDWNSDGSFDLGAINIKMVVTSIKSTEGSIMNNNTYKALKSDSNPDITFVLTAPVKSAATGANGRTIEAKINLSIAGVTKAIDMPVTAIGQAQGDITFEGSKTIKMTDYGIKPPVALFGTLKTGDEITIHFKAVFVKSN